MAADLSDRDLRLLRMRSQGLLPGSERKSVAAAAAKALAIQAQDVGTGLLGVRARTSGLTAEKAARARGACRSWLMRNTLFLFAEKDLAWLRPLLSERPLTPALRRLEQVGMPEKEVDRVLDLIADQIADGPVPRQEVREALLDDGLVPGENNARVYWTFHVAALRGVFAIKPPLLQRQTFAGTIPNEEIGREDALGRLGRRFLEGHGPAMPEDLAYWAKIPRAMAREAFERAGRVVELDAAGGRMSALPSQAKPPPPTGEPVVRLLGSWDHWLLSWVDRGLVMPESEKDVFLVSGRPSAYADGLAFATWRMERAPGSLSVVVEPFSSVPRGARPGWTRRSPTWAASSGLIPSCGSSGPSSAHDQVGPRQQEGDAEGPLPCDRCLLQAQDTEAIDHDGQRQLTGNGRGRDATRPDLADQRQRREDVCGPQQTAEQVVPVHVGRAREPAGLSAEDDDGGQGHGAHRERDERGGEAAGLLTEAGVDRRLERDQAADDGHQEDGEALVHQTMVPDAWFLMPGA